MLKEDIINEIDEDLLDEGEEIEIGEIIWVKKGGKLRWIKWKF